MLKSIKTAALFALAGCFSLTALSGISRASTLLYNGETVDGWTITTSPGVTLSEGPASSSTVLDLMKSVDFTSNAGAIITFTQSPTASTASAATIQIANENITNNTGAAWTSFDQILLNPLASITPPVVSGPATITHTFGASLGYFTSSTFSNTASTFSSDATLTGGTVPDGATEALFGDEGLQIAAAPSTGLAGQVTQSFMLKELPTAGAPAIPLPAAAWSGLSGLVGLGLLSGLKKLRKHHA